MADKSQRTTRLQRRARTDVRRLAAWTLLVGATTLGLAFGFSANERSIQNRTLIVKRPAQCVALKSGEPSAGCRRIARLVLQTCILQPGLCERAVREARARLSVARRRALDGVLRRIVADRPSRGSNGRGTGRKRRPARRAPRRGAPAPSRGGSGGAAPAPAGGSSGGGGGSSPAPARPTPSDAVNSAKDRIRDSLNDTTDAAGAGRPVPPLPDVPLPDLGAPPAICPRPPIC